MRDLATRAELLALIDFLWEERHDTTRNTRSGVPASETPLEGWVIESALTEHAQNTDPREFDAIAAFANSLGPVFGGPHYVIASWWSRVETYRNTWRRKVGAPTYTRRPRPT